MKRPIWPNERTEKQIDMAEGFCIALFVSAAAATGLWVADAAQWQYPIAAWLAWAASMLMYFGLLLFVGSAIMAERSEK